MFVRLLFVVVCNPWNAFNIIHYNTLLVLSNLDILNIIIRIPFRIVVVLGYFPSLWWISYNGMITFHRNRMRFGHVVKISQSHHNRVIILVEYNY